MTRGLYELEQEPGPRPGDYRAGKPQLRAATETQGCYGVEGLYEAVDSATFEVDGSLYSSAAWTPEGWARSCALGIRS
jgi:hypothetical protein